VSTLAEQFHCIACKLGFHSYQAYANHLIERHRRK
jgi:hypothetical protein